MVHPEEYRNSPALSQSDLKLLETNVRKFHREKILGEEGFKRSYTRSMEIGDIGDVLLTDNANFGNIYYVYGSDRVSETLKKIADAVMAGVQKRIEEGDYTENQFIINPITAYEQEFYEEAKKVETVNPKGETVVGYRNNYKEDTLKADLMELCQKYWEDLKMAYGKTMINMKDYAVANEVIQRIKEDPFTSKILAPLLFPEIHPDHDVKLQLMLFGKVDDTETRGLLDITIFDNLNRTITYVDLKISHTPDQFMDSYRKFQYYRQGPFYVRLLQQAYPDYTLNLPLFIVGFTSLDFKPEIFMMSLNDFQIGMTGGESKGGYRIKGYQELISDYEWHKVNNLWEHSRDYYQTGQTTIDTFK